MGKRIDFKKVIHYAISAIDIVNKLKKYNNSCVIQIYYFVAKPAEVVAEASRG
jgi:hypothetical protein